MKNTPVYLIFVLIQNLCFAQTDFREGYVLLHPNDTLYGLVDYREGANAHKSCSFKQNKDGAVTSYGPGEIVAYGFVHEKVFRSREITLKDELPKTVFLEVVIEGLVSLYKFDKTFWVEKDDHVLYQLTNQSSPMHVEEDGWYEKKSNQYISVLNILMFDCVEIRSRIADTELNEKSLTKLVTDYNHCKGSPVIAYKARKVWFQVILGVTVGTNTSKVSFSSLDTSYDYLFGPFEPSTSLMLGLSLDLHSPRLTERFSFHLNPTYLRTNYYRHTIINGPTIEQNTIDIELHQLKLPAGFRYTFPEKFVTPFVNVGICGTIHLSSNSTSILQLEHNGFSQTFTYEAVEIALGQLGIFGGLGILLSVNEKWTAVLETRYEQTSGISPQTVDLRGLHSKVKNLQLILGLRIK